MLVFPDLQSGNIAFKLLSTLGRCEAIGPLLVGLENPVNLISYNSTVTEIVNMAALSAYQVAEEA